MSSEKFSFENLNVYKKALVFCNAIYDITAQYPKEERFILIDQFRRAAISIYLNIAEGYGESSLGFKRYLNIAKGSVRECVAIVTLSKMRKYIDAKTEDTVRDQLIELSRMISGLIQSLKRP